MTKSKADKTAILTVYLILIAVFINFFCFLETQPSSADLGDELLDVLGVDTKFDGLRSFIYLILDDIH